MAVSFVSSGVTDTISTNSPFSTSAFNIGTLTNGALVVWVFLGSASAPSSISATWNSVSMLQVPSTATASANTGYVTMFGLINPANGGNTLSVTFAGFSGVSGMLGFFSFSGSDQSANSTTFINGVSFQSSSTNTTFTQAVTTANGNATCFGWGSAQTLTAASCTPALDWHDNNIANIGLDGGGQHTLSSTSSDSYKMVQGATDNAEGCGCSILASAGGGDTLMPQILMRDIQARAAGLFAGRSRHLPWLDQGKPILV